MIGLPAVEDNYWRTVVCAKYDDKTWLTSAIGWTRSAKLVSPTDKGLTIAPTAWQNPYFKEQIPIVGLSGFIPQI